MGFRQWIRKAFGIRPPEGWPWEQPREMPDHQPTKEIQEGTWVQSPDRPYEPGYIEEVDSARVRIRWAITGKVTHVPAAAASEFVSVVDEDEALGRLDFHFDHEDPDAPRTSVVHKDSTYMWPPPRDDQP